MGRFVISVTVISLVLFRTAAADDATEKPKQESGSSLSALMKLADQLTNDDPAADPARPADQERPVRNRNEKAEPKAVEKARPAAKADAAKRARDDADDPRPPRQARNDRQPVVNRAAVDRDARGRQFGNNPVFVPGGGFGWSPAPYQPVLIGDGLNGYGYRNRNYGYGGYGYGYNSFYPYYGYGFFPSPVAISIGPPVDVRYDDPAGHLRQTLLESARRNANYPAGLSPQRK